MSSEIYWNNLQSNLIVLSETRVNRRVFVYRRLLLEEVLCPEVIRLKIIDILERERYWLDFISIIITRWTTPERYEPMPAVYSPYTASLFFLFADIFVLSLVICLICIDYVFIIFFRRIIVWFFFHRVINWIFLRQIIVWFFFSPVFFWFFFSRVFFCRVFFWFFVRNERIEVLVSKYTLFSISCFSWILLILFVSVIYWSFYNTNFLIWFWLI